MSTNGAVENSRRRSFTPNVILLFILSLIVVFAVVVVSISSNKEVAKWNLSTPQGVVQSYITDLMNGKTDRAATLLSKESECDIQDLDRAFVQAEMRVYLSSTTIAGEKASVTVKADIPTGGPFADYSSESHTLRLVRSDGSWKLLGIPWPLYDCEVIQK